MVTLVAAGYLGFALIHLNHDKLIHALTFFIITIEVYWLFDTNNKSHKTVRLITFLSCTVGASITLEVVQNVVNPSRIFDVYDIGFNMMGSLVGLGGCVVVHGYIIKRNRQLRYRRLNRDEERVEPTTPDEYVNIKMQDILHSVD